MVEVRVGGGEKAVMCVMGIMTSLWEVMGGENGGGVLRHVGGGWDLVLLVMCRCCGEGSGGVVAAQWWTL